MKQLGLGRNALMAAMLWSVTLGGAALLCERPGWAQRGSAETYLEFGTVVGLSQQGIEVQVQDPGLHRDVQRSFAFSRFTQADVVHVGDAVEVIYSVDGTAASQARQVERLIALHGSIPRMGPPPASAGPPAAAPVLSAGASARPAISPSPSGSAPPAAISAAPPAAPPSGFSSAPASAPKSRAARRAAASAEAARKNAASLAAERASREKAASSANRPVALAPVSKPAVPAVVPVYLGGAAEKLKATTPRATVIAPQAVGEQCNRTGDWANQPLTVAVLDFRYPTEQEEEHDSSSVGGGSGTAVADLVYNRLASDPHLALSRGDREKVFRMDFAGAARLGRQLGVDAVLLGTLAPVEIPNADPEFPPATQAYTLSAGVVETCTGELLYRLTSGSCSGGKAAAPSCLEAQVSTRAAANPMGNVSSFEGPIARLVEPLEREGMPAGAMGDAGLITAVDQGTVTLRAAAGMTLRVGDQVKVDASRLAKIPATKTLHVFKGEEIGRVTIRSVTGGSASGIYQGNVPAMAGDSVDKITPEPAGSTK